MAIAVEVLSHRFVDWATSNRMKTGLAMEAMGCALTTRTNLTDFIHHSDKGSQHCSGANQKLMKKHGIAASMSSKGNCSDTLKWRACSRRKKHLAFTLRAFIVQTDGTQHWAINCQ
ncbi:DDE-type integrase/transposase/recombinase [Polycladidibacter stylochi]|uniref:DDE-type integrase/transposase/recombinase n=1 Tax=Polycladidibacter stylochi TaxID=1807766 RepID=UPI000A7585BA